MNETKDAHQETKIMLKEEILKAIRTASLEKKRKLAERIRTEMLRLGEKQNGKEASK